MRALSPARKGILAVVLVVAAGLGLRYLGETRNKPTESPDESAPSRASVSTDCRPCHAAQYDSWHRSYHRTMTREATPETVKGNFGNVAHDYQGIATRLKRTGDAYFMEVVDPDWAAVRARAKDQPDRVPPPRYQQIRVDRVIGSHWIQEYLHRDPTGRYVRLPVLYHLGERRWVHSLGAFLAPESDDFWARSRGANWNESCLYCHNTEPSKNPVRDVRGSTAGYETEVAELGIACAACHGPGVEHIRLHSGAGGQSDVVHPASLSIARRDEICARCHGALVPKPSEWDPQTHRDPFVPGRELWQYNHLFRSETEQHELAGLRPRSGTAARPGPDDGRFWGDGTPLTTALEYNGLSMSACYQDGRGTLSCLTCHTMHGPDPNYMLKPDVQSNAACYQCHEQYRDRLAEHTRHAVGSPGSLCYNCHMPHQVYSLMTTHRSHRIQVPDIASSLGTGKPHACNLCHLDKSLGWTRDNLAKWPNGKRDASGTLSNDEMSVASSILILSRGDARSRVIVAGAFSSPHARQASGTDWVPSMLTRLMEEERYPVVRYLLERGLPKGDGPAAPFDHLATRKVWSKHLQSLRSQFDATPVRRTIPALPLTTAGLPDEPALIRLRRGRHDPDLTINE